MILPSKMLNNFKNKYQRSHDPPERTKSIEVKATLEGALLRVLR